MGLLRDGPTGTDSPIAVDPKTTYTSQLHIYLIYNLETFHFISQTIFLWIMDLPHIVFHYAGGF